MGKRARRLLVAAGSVAGMSIALPALALGPSPVAPPFQSALNVSASGTPTSLAPDCEWAMYGHDPSRTMSSSCVQAPTTSTVTGMLPRWHIHTDDVVTATPTVYGGVVYVGDWSGKFYAIDLKTGSPLWTTVLGPKRPDGNADHHTGAYGTITSSAAVARIANRLVVFVGAGGSLYALDGTSTPIPDAQRVLWHRDFDPGHPTSHGEVESSPVVWMGAPGGPAVVVGSDANQDSGYAGEGVWAVRADPGPSGGSVLWHFNPETYTQHALFGCGNVWSSPALGLDSSNPDPSRRAVLYFGTADCPNNSGTPCPTDGSDQFCTPGHQYQYGGRWQVYAESITALSALTGIPIWSYQGHPVNSNDDDDYGASAQLFSLPNGEQVVGEAGKDGLYVVLDRRTGSLVWRAPETGNGNLQPGFALGGFIGTTAVEDVAGRPTVFGGVAINTPVTYDSAGNPTLQDAQNLLRGIPGMQAFSGLDGSSAWFGVQPYTYGSTSAANGVVYVGAL
ncbi:MAG TPA: PQQ-binding-like beta-propeller repeat protein, partial [Acidimicrobiales bacterium]|nr:PQQ-binding-like beta-propeller repeat protein [Acidimicrobiales bacterium]